MNKMRYCVPITPGMFFSLMSCGFGIVLWGAGPLPAAEPPEALGVRSLAFSPDGKSLAAAYGEPDTSGEVAVWDLKARSRRFTINEKKGVSSVAYSDDGALLAAGGYDHAARLIDTETGEVLRTFAGHSGPVRSVAFSPDGQTLATGSWDKTARLWEVSTGQVRSTLEGHADRVWCVAYSPDGKHLATAGLGDRAIVWDADTGKIVREFLHGEPFVMSVAYSPDGAWLFTACFHGRARIWNVATGEVRSMVKTRAGGLNSAIFSPHGELLALTNSDGRALEICQLDLGDASAEQQKEIDALVARLDDGDFAAREATGKALQAYGMRAEPALRQAIASTSAEVRIRARLLRQAVRSVEPVRKLTRENALIETVAFSPDGKLLATGGKSGEIVLWDLATDTEIGVLQRDSQ